MTPVEETNDVKKDEIEEDITENDNVFGGEETKQLADDQNSSVIENDNTDTEVAARTHVTGGTAEALDASEDDLSKKRIMDNTDSNSDCTTEKVENEQAGLNHDVDEETKPIEEVPNSTDIIENYDIETESSQTHAMEKTAAEVSVEDLNKKRKMDNSDGNDNGATKKVLHVEIEKAAVDCGHGYLKNMDITNMTYEEYLTAFKELQGRSKAKYDKAQQELKQLEQEHRQQQRMQQQHNMNFNHMPMGGGPMLGGPMGGPMSMPHMGMGPGPHMGGGDMFYPMGPPGPGVHMH